MLVGLLRMRDPDAARMQGQIELPQARFRGALCSMSMVFDKRAVFFRTLVGAGARFFH